MVQAINVYNNDQILINGQELDGLMDAEYYTAEPDGDMADECDQQPGQQQEQQLRGFRHADQRLRGRRVGTPLTAAGRPGWHRSPSHPGIAAWPPRPCRALAAEP